MRCSAVCIVLRRTFTGTAGSASGFSGVCAGSTGRSRRADIADVERFGLRWRLYRTGNVSDSRLLLRPDSFDPLETDLLLQRARTGFAFVDVGANCGFYALRVAAAGGRVVAIEPHPEMFRRLQFNAALNPDSPVRLLQCAVGDRKGEIRLAEDSRNLGRTRIDDTGAVAVEMRPLLDILGDEGLERLDALKVDVEGFEDRVLVPFLQGRARSAKRSCPGRSSPSTPGAITGPRTGGRSPANAAIANGRARRPATSS